MERIRMDRVNAILKHKTYRKYYDQIEKIEKDRIFCRHQMPHLLDVARIAYITNLERNLYLTTQILEIDVPVVIALNMIWGMTGK